MANEFDYSANLSILHPSIDPKVITAAITELHPVIEAMAGSDRRDVEGNLVMPPRKSMCSHWLAPLHTEKRLHSGNTVLSEFIMGRLAVLERHRDLFHELDQEGEVTLVIALYTRSNYSADVIQAETLKQCGELGINLELDIYSDN